jgi:hypothetical protein
MGMISRITLLLLVFLVGCGPIDPRAASIGAQVTPVYVIDARSLKCIKFSSYRGGLMEMHIAPDALCGMSSVP